MALDPKTTASLIDGGSKVLGSALSSRPGPSNAELGVSQTFDNSGFAVNFGRGSANAAQSSQVLPWLVAAGGAAFFLWVFLKKR